MTGTGILAIILVLGGLIFFHELGHFLVARMLGIGVKVFSLGFGPRLASFGAGNTRYQLCLIPLGGYVQLVEEPSGDELPAGFTQEESFALRPPGHRILVVLAGPVFNFLLAWVLYALLLFAYGQEHMLPVIGEVMPDSPAASAGLLPGDRITAINNTPVPYWEDMVTAIRASNGQPLSCTVKREETRLLLEMTPGQQDTTNLFGEPVTVYVIGVTPRGDATITDIAFMQAVTDGAVQTWGAIRLMAVSLVKIIQGVVSLDTLGGPIMIGDLVNQQAKKGLADVLYLAAFISINLGFLNLLPIPVFDGGQFLFFSMEILFRRPVSAYWQMLTTRIGMAMLIALMALAIFNDLYRVIVN